VKTAIFKTFATVYIPADSLVRRNKIEAENLREVSPSCVLDEQGCSSVRK